MTIPAKLIETADLQLSVAVLIFPVAVLLAFCLAVFKKETYNMAPSS